MYYGNELNDVFLRSLRTNYFLQHIIIILSKKLNIKSVLWHLIY